MNLIKTGKFGLITALNKKIENIQTINIFYLHAKNSKYVSAVFKTPFTQVANI